MFSKEEYNIFRLYRSKNIGTITFMKLLDIYKTCEEAINNINDFNKKYKTQIIIKSKEEIDKEIEETYNFGAKIITYKSIEYPIMLKNIYGFPIILTLYGNYELLNKRCISIVGSRNASSNGCNFAKKISRELSLNNFVIVSGMANGIDSFSHIGALENGTIAILGTGINKIYPSNNKNLYEEIKNKGLLISEFPFNTLPKAENFPLRNRIISGLSEGVVIIEASEKSGTLITARLAIDQGRELFVAPGNPYDYRCIGSNQLIKDGANILTCVEDILDIIGIKNNYISTAKIKTNDEEKNNISIIKQSTLNYDEMERKILSKLNHTPIEIDIIYKELDMEINQFNSKLIELELQNKIIVENGFIKLK